ADIYGIGSQVRLLPYLEQNAQYQLYIFSTGEVEGKNHIWYNFYNAGPQFAPPNQANRPRTDGTDVVPRPPAVYGGEGNFKVFLCPSAPQPEETVSVLMLANYGGYGDPKDYGICAVFNAPFAHIFSSAPGRDVLGRCNYLGVAGWCTHDFPTYFGLLHYKS